MSARVGFRFGEIDGGVWEIFVQFRKLLRVSVYLVDGRMLSTS